MSGEHLERRLEGLESEFADAALERLRAVLARASDDALLDLAAARTCATMTRTEPSSG